MCRLFGFRSNLATRVHRALVEEKNSLRVQSSAHRDGWGIAFYGDDVAPNVVHGLGPAHEDPEFERQCGLVTSRTVLAHVRLASVGGVQLANAHPFIHQRWAFAHNGTVREFARVRQALEARIAPDLRDQLRGETDSERCFYLVLTRLRERCPDLRVDDVGHLAWAVAQAMREVLQVCQLPDVEAPALNFLITDGDQMVASRLRRSLFYSEAKRRAACGGAAPAPGAQLAQWVIASEQLSSEDHWHEVSEGELVGVDRDLRFQRWSMASFA